MYKYINNDNNLLFIIYLLDFYSDYFAKVNVPIVLLSLWILI